MADRKDEKTRPVAYRLFLCGLRQADLGLSGETEFIIKIVSILLMLCKHMHKISFLAGVCARVLHGPSIKLCYTKVLYVPMGIAICHLPRWMINGKRKAVSRI